MALPINNPISDAPAKSAARAKFEELKKDLSSNSGIFSSINSYAELPKVFANAPEILEVFIEVINEELKGGTPNNLRFHVDELLKENIDKRISRVEKLVEPANDLMRVATHILEVWCKVLNVPVKESVKEAPVNEQPSPLQEQPGSQILVEEGAPLAGEGKAAEVKGIQQGFESLINAAVHSIPSSAFDQILDLFQIVTESVASHSKVNGLPGGEEFPGFQTLVGKLGEIKKSNRALKEKGADLLEAFSAFSKEFEELTINGFSVFSNVKKVDAGDTPHFEYLSSIEKLKNVVDPVAEDKKGEDLSVFKRDFSNYFALRFVYEYIAGCVAEEGFYNEIFTELKKTNGSYLDKEFGMATFKALNQAKGLSKARGAAAKLVFQLIQPAITAFVEAVIDNVEKKILPLLQNEAAVETLGHKILAKFSKYVESLVFRFGDIADGIGIDKSGGISHAMLQKLRDPECNGGVSLSALHDQTIREGISKFFPRIGAAEKVLDRLDRVKFKEGTRLARLNPVVTAFKVVPYGLLFIVLYGIQEVLNFIAQFSVKQVLIRAHVLDGFVDKVAAISEQDLYIRIAGLKGMQSVLMKALEALKKEPSKTDKPRSGDPKAEPYIKTLISNILLSMDLGSASNVMELQKKVGAARDPTAQGILSFSVLGKTIDLTQTAQGAIAANLSVAYRDLIEGIKPEFVKEQVQGINKVLNGMFDPKQLLSGSKLKDEVLELEKHNRLLLEDLVDFLIKKEIDPQIDITGKPQIEKLHRAVANTKRCVDSFVQARPTTGEAIERFISQMESYAQESSQDLRIQNLLAGCKGHVTLYAQALKKGDQAEIHQVLQELAQWGKEIPLPKNLNIEVASDWVNKLLDLGKRGARQYIKAQVEQLFNFFSNSYNAAGIARMSLELFANENLLAQIPPLPRPEAAPTIKV